MGITYSILGAAGGDNALLVQVDSGQALERLLFDCGDGCVRELPFADVQAIDDLFFSHLHMDHVGGFDTFFRATYGRVTKPNRIWGPPDTARIMQHCFQGFLWNLCEEMSATWLVSDVGTREIRTTRFELGEAFGTAHDAGTEAREGSNVVEGAGYVVQCATMDHRAPALAFVVREKTRRNIDTDRMRSLGLRPGPWLKQLKESSVDSATVEIDGTTHSVAALREALIIETQGESIAYLTDFLLDETAMASLADMLTGVTTIVCEAQYRHSDVDLARRNCHMTSV